MCELYIYGREWVNESVRVKERQNPKWLIEHFRNLGAFQFNVSRNKQNKTKKNTWLFLNRFQIKIISRPSQYSSSSSSTYRIDIWWTRFALNFYSFPYNTKSTPTYCIHTERENSHLNGLTRLTIESEDVCLWVWV